MLRNCRTVFATAAVLILAFGVVYELVEPEGVDPSVVRLALGALCGSLFLGSFYIEVLRRRCVEITAALLGVIEGWFILLTAVNGFSASYSLGLVFTVAAVGFALLMTQNGVKPVAIYTSATTSAVATFIIVMQPPWANAILTLGAVAGIGVIVVLSSQLKTHLISSLEASERRFRKLSEAAFEAIFITDDDVIVDCNPNALALLGHSARERIIGCRLADFMPDAAPASCMTSTQPVAPYRYESTVLRGDGVLVPVEIRGRSTSEDGHRVCVMAVRDISEQKEYERQLIESRRRVEETLKIRNTILTNVSHEFRTPLAIMLGYAEMLKENKFDDAGEMGELIYDSGRRLNETLNLILELAQIESGRAARSGEPVDIAALVEDVVRSQRGRAAVKLLGLSFEAIGTSHTAVADRASVLKILNYLVDNALKFTEEGTVDVRVESDTEWTRVYVRDTGIGIDAEFLPYVFDPFKQESSGLTRSHGGLGVGLTIARQMAEAMGGTVTVESMKGIGTTITLSLPRTPVLEGLPTDAQLGSLPPEWMEHERNASALWM